MVKFLLATILCFSTIYSEAEGLRCFDLFSQNKVTSAKTSATYYAEAIDSLNAKYNRFLFKENLSDLLDPALNSKQNDSPFWQRTTARYRAYKLRKILKSLHEHDQYLNSKADLEADFYALEKLAVKLEKLSFLADESVTEKMSLTEKAVYRQAQHSLLSQGLARFLFSNEPRPSPARLKKIFKAVMTPFKDIYFRWTYAVFVMPKLDGATIPYSVIEKVVWDGYEQHKELLAPYLTKAHSKYFFNTFSTVYNWVMVITLATSIGQLAHTTYYDVYLQGQAQAEQMLAPTLQQSEKIAHTDFAQVKQEQTLQNFMIDFKIKFNRDPSAEELEMIKQLILSRSQKAN